MRPFPMLPVLLSTALLGVCCSAHESPPIPEEKFAHLYAELLVMAADDSTRSMAEAPAGRRADSLLTAAGVTPEDYRTTVDWYNEDVTRWRGLLAQVVTLLEGRLERADSLLSGSGPAGKETSESGAGGQPPR